MLKHLSLLLLTLSFTSCAVYIPSNYNESNGKEWGQIPSGSTVKVIQEKANDQYILHLEDALARKGFFVIGSNTFTQSAIVADYNYQTVDTTIYRYDRRPQITELFPDKPADYIMRYRYVKGYADEISLFSASVTNTNTGRVEATYTHDRTIGNTTIFREMISDMLNRWQ